MTDARAATATGAARIHTLFDARCAQSPDHVFMHTAGGAWTLAQLSQRVDVLQDELLSLGVGLGDRVLVAAENCPEHVALILACSRVGAWSCGVNARMSAAEWAMFAARADARVSYFTAAVSDAAASHADRARARDSAVPGLRRSDPRPEATAQDGALASRVAAMIFTSGTTGDPKGVMVSHAGLLHFARVSTDSRALSAADRSYACIPVTHIFGLATVLMASLHAGASLVMRPRFDPADAFEALAQHRVSQLQGPPAMFTRLLQWLDEHGIARPAAPQLRYLYAGAAPLDLRLKQSVEQRFGQVLHHGYGLSEYAGALCVPRLNERRDDTAAGYLVDGGELRIVDAAGRDLPQGETGEIWMRGAGLMPGYFRDEAATAAVMRTGGWYASGDLGRLDAGGALHLVGRLKEMIIHSGFNVYPGEVERAINAFDGVHRSAVVGRREADGNESVIAFIEVPPGQPAPDMAALQAHLAAHLSPYKQPAQIVCVPAFPMTLSGKILKRELLART